MSRGGRGGFRGGKGGLDSRLGLDYDQSLDLLTDTKPSELFPPVPPPVAEPLSHAERQAVHHFRTLRARIHDGPFYCLLDRSSRATASAANKRAAATAFFDAFEDQPTYTQRFRKPTAALPNLAERPFVPALFPRELWPTMGVADDGGLEGVTKRLKLSQRTKLDKWMKEAGEEGEEGDVAEEKEDADEEVEDKEGVEGEEDGDPDQFDEDDEDENDDYNAEQYFSGGEDDDYGDDGGGGGEDDY